MLVLSRKPGESLQLGPGITLTVLAISGLRVKIGVSAPADVEVWRAELIQRQDPSCPAAKPVAGLVMGPTPHV